MRPEGPCKDVVPQWECLVSEVGVRKIRENGRQLFEIAADRTGCGKRGDNFFFEISTISGHIALLSKIL